MKKISYMIVIFVLALTLCLIWWILPTKLIRINPQNVSKIVIFNGNNGNEIEITDRSEVEHIINNLKSISVKKEKISVGYMGYSYRTTIYQSNDRAYKSFIINSEDTIRKDPFFYKDRSRSIDYNFIKTLFNNSQ